MGKNYLFILLFTLAFFTHQKGMCQDMPKGLSSQQNNEELSIYPNPVTAGETTVYINSKLNSSKKVEFFNVLGKRIFSTTINGNELNISNLSKGVYIVKITEKDITRNRKLIIK